MAANHSAAERNRPARDEYVASLTNGGFVSFNRTRCLVLVAAGQHSPPRCHRWTAGRTLAQVAATMPAAQVWLPASAQRETREMFVRFAVALDYKTAR
jgi:hypothetical protein